MQKKNDKVEGIITLTQYINTDRKHIDIEPWWFSKNGLKIFAEKNKIGIARKYYVVLLYELEGTEIVCSK